MIQLLLQKDIFSLARLGVSFNGTADGWKQFRRLAFVGFLAPPHSMLLVLLVSVFDSVGFLNSR